MAVFLRNLMGGRIIDPDREERMTRTPYPTLEAPWWYRLGLMVLDAADPEGGGSGSAIPAGFPARGR
jgi:hypothetical protein